VLLWVEEDRAHLCDGAGADALATELDHLQPVLGREVLTDHVRVDRFRLVSPHQARDTGRGGLHDRQTAPLGFAR
jgi:hypothetical protein